MRFKILIKTIFVLFFLGILTYFGLFKYYEYKDLEFYNKFERCESNLDCNINQNCLEMMIPSCSDCKGGAIVNVCIDNI